jgi:Dullard-like phosphatase family protein
MSKEKNSKKEKQSQIEERIKYFMKLQSNKNVKQKNLKRIPNFHDYSTLIDPINIQNEGTNAIFINNLTLIMNNNRIESVKNNIPNAINDIIKDKRNDSTITTQTINNLNFPIKRTVSIPVSKELAKYTEPSLKKKQLLKISPKFTTDDEKIENIPDCKTSRNNHSHKYSEHNYTKSEFEILKTEEEIPQEQLEEIANNILFMKTQKINNNKDIIYKKEDMKKNIIGIFHYLINIEKCYRELSDDLKNNGLQNLEYKLKIACLFINLIKDEKNMISDIFFQDGEDINSFLNRELCLYLTFLFFDEYSKGLNDNHIREFLICHNYCNINLLYLILVIIKKFEKYIKENEIKFDENNNEYNDYQKCKILIELNSDKIKVEKYKENFHTNNKIIKNVFLNLLNILKDINPNITKIINEFFISSKKSKFKTILNNYLKTNSFIKEKTEEIQKKCHSENISDKENGNALNDEDIIKEILPPYLPPKKKDDKRDYCLVLDLDETLVHFFEDNFEAYVKVRMGAENFITVLSQYCEIVIFTASTQYYADIVIDGLDCKNLIDYKLYREHTYDYNGVNVKDLSKLGRDLKKIIIIDNIAENYIFQPNNGLNILNFEGDENDNELQYLLEDLLEVVSKPGKNILLELPKIRKKMKERYNKTINN